MHAWVSKNKAVLIAAGFSAIVLLFVAPWFGRAMLGVIYPPKPQGGIKVFGRDVGGTIRPDPRVESRLLFLLGGGWALWATGTAVLLFARRPGADGNASVIAKNRAADT